MDGVLNPFAARRCPPGYAEHELFPGEEPVRLCAEHGPWIKELATRFELVWATGWGLDANRVLGPRFGLPDLAAIEFPPVPFDPREKLPAVIRQVGLRPLAWIDDALPPAAEVWASSRGTPTLLIDIDPAEGLTRAVVDRALQWVDGPALSSLR